MLASCADTNDDLFAVEVRMYPGGGPPVMHRHAPSEIYFVQAGEFTFYLGAGDSVRCSVPFPRSAETPSAWSQCSKRQRVAPPGSATATQKTVWTVTVYRYQGGGPALGALYGPVNASPCTSAGQPVSR